MKSFSFILLVSFLLAFSVFFKQDSPPGGNDKRRTCPSITCSGLGLSHHALAGRGRGTSVLSWLGVTHLVLPPAWDWRMLSPGLGYPLPRTRVPPRRDLGPVTRVPTRKEMGPLVGTIMGWRWGTPPPPPPRC